MIPYCTERRCELQKIRKEERRRMDERSYSVASVTWAVVEGDTARSVCVFVCVCVCAVFIPVRPLHIRGIEKIRVDVRGGSWLSGSLFVIVLAEKYNFYLSKGKQELAQHVLLGTKPLISLFLGREREKKKSKEKRKDGKIEENVLKKSDNGSK